MNLTDHEKLFFNDGYQLGKEAFGNGSGNQQLLKSVAKMYEAIDQLIDSLADLAAKQGVSIHCQKGCSWCCHQAVFANTYELEYLEAFINNHFGKDEIENIKEKAFEKDKYTSLLNSESVLNHKSPCPLLKEGTCLAYEARPMACRIYLSMQVKTCIEFYKNPENEKNYPALLDFPLKAGRLMNEGFMAALLEEGIVTDEFRLEEGLIKVLGSDSN